MKGLLIIGSVVALAGCMGQVGDANTTTATDAPTYAWLTKVIVSPDAPAAGAHVSMDLHLTSQCSDAVTTDIVLRVVHSSGRTLYTQNWSDIAFQPSEGWDLNQGFLPGTDDRGTATIWVTVTDHASGVVLYLNNSSTVTLR